jgi:hypothetical protein
VRTGRRIVERPLELGDLDPLETRSGLQARLSNLGYCQRPADLIASGSADLIGGAARIA